MIPLDGNQAHYLISLMRVKEGDIILLFDNRTGEWAAEARNIRKRYLALHIVSQTKPLETVPDFLLFVAPVKKGRIDLVAEKACALGVTRLQPVLTRRAVVYKPNLPLLHSHHIGREHVSTPVTNEHLVYRLPPTKIIQLFTS